MNLLKKIIILSLVFFSLNTIVAQQIQNYYYYGGQKIFLQLDTKRISVALKDKNFQTVLSQVNLTKGIAKPSEIVEDHPSTLFYENNKALNSSNVKSFYGELSSNVNKTEREYVQEMVAYNKAPNVILASPSFKTKEGKTMGLTNKFYVKLQKSSDISILLKQAKEKGVTVIGRDKFMPLWYVVSVDKSTNKNALILANEFYETKLFAASEPAFTYHNLLLSNDPYYKNQWSLKNTGQNGGIKNIDINVEKAWTITSGSSNIKTAVYDHGFEMNHPDLKPVTYGTGFDATAGTSPSVVRGNHGTACAGIVGAKNNNKEGISGVAPNSKLVSISIKLYLSDTPQQLASGFSWAWRNGVDVISNSWGGYKPSNIIEDAIKEALTKGRKGKGTVIVFAAGNEDNQNIRFPGNSNDALLVVGAMSPCGERKNKKSCDKETWWGSCYGKKLDVVAPGVLMPTTDRQGSNGYKPGDYRQDFNGTSSACPVVAGVAALVLSVNPSLKVKQVTDIIEKSARKVRTDLYTYSNKSGRTNGTWNDEMGYGLVDAYKAVLLAKSIGCIPNIVVTSNVNSGNTDIRKASNSIIAKNTIFSGGVAKYQAGKKIVLTTGFKAVQGSKFSARIANCITSSNSNFEDIVEDDYIVDTDVFDLEKTVANNVESIDKNENYVVVPNPTTDEVRILHNFNPKEDYFVELYDFSGKVILRKSINSDNNVISLAKFNSGIYVIKIVNKENISVKKIMLKK